MCEKFKVPEVQLLKEEEKLNIYEPKFTYLLQVLKLASTATLQELAWVRVCILKSYCLNIQTERILLYNHKNY